MHVPLSTKQYKLVPASAGTYCTTGAVLVGWQPIGRRCSWWPTGAAPASLIPVVAVVFFCGLSDVLINEYLFILFVRNFLNFLIVKKIYHRPTFDRVREK